jgi:hypothetical protein
VIYGREALRKFREEREQGEERQATLLEQIPADAPMDDATINVWNGQRWVAWDKWLATAPLIVEEKPREETKSEPGKEAAPAADSRPQDSAVQEELW